MDEFKHVQEEQSAILRSIRQRAANLRYSGYADFESGPTEDSASPNEELSAEAWMWLASTTVALLTGFAASVMGCIGGMGVFPGHLSGEDLSYAVTTGLAWGLLGSPLLTGASWVAPTSHRWVVIIVGAVLWACLVGFCFFVYIEAMSHC